MVSVEAGLRVNRMARRSDLLVFGPRGEPVLLAEFKAPDVAITAAVFEQAARYNTVHRCPWLVVSNGLRHYCCRIEQATGTVSFQARLPDYTTLCAPDAA